jgi:hypothetical protein
MLMSVALLVCQVSVVDCPLLIVSGLAVNDAVGAAGAGGGGGGGGGCFLWHAPRNKTPPSAKTRADDLNVSCFIFSPFVNLLLAVSFWQSNRPIAES